MPSPGSRPAVTKGARVDAGSAPCRRGKEGPRLRRRPVGIYRSVCLPFCVRTTTGLVPGQSSGVRFPRQLPCALARAKPACGPSRAGHLLPEGLLAQAQAAPLQKGRWALGRKRVLKPVEMRPLESPEKGETEGLLQGSKDGGPLEVRGLGVGRLGWKEPRVTGASQRGCEREWTQPPRTPVGT